MQIFRNHWTAKSVHFSPLAFPRVIIPFAPFSSLPPFQNANSNPNDSDELVSNVVSILKEQRSRSRWGFLRSLYPKTPFTPTQISQIVLHLRNRPRLALAFFRWCSPPESHHLRPLAVLVHVLARARLRSYALEVLHSATLAAGNDPDTVFRELVGTYRVCDSSPLVFDLVVRACVGSKRVGEALEIVRMLKSKGISPESRTSGDLIRLVSKARGPDAGFELYKEIYGAGGRSRGCSPRVSVFNALLVSFYRVGRLGEVAKVICDEMERFGCHPNCFTFCILMAGLCDEGRVEEAVVVWEDMRFSKKIEPDIVAYNTLIGGLCDVRDVGRAEELFKEMDLDGNGVQPTNATFEHLVRGYCSNGDVDGAVLVYNDMRRRGYGLEVSVAEKVIGELCERGRVAEGLRVLRNEMRRQGFHPSRRCFECLIKGLCSNGRMEEAARLQSEMVGKGFDADAEVYDAFMDGHLRKGEKDKVARLKEEMSDIGILKMEDG